MENAGLFIQAGLLIVTFSAAIISLKQLRGHNDKENNKLLSQLNKRYTENKDVQAVVLYLREIDPTNKEPEAYQVELFLRFFEELGIYLKTNSIRKDDVKEFFNFYFDQYERTTRGRILKSKIHNEDTEEYLPYLEVYREEMKK